MADEVAEAGALTRLDDAVDRYLATHGTESGETIFSRNRKVGFTVHAVSLVAAGACFTWRQQRREAVALALASVSAAAVDTLLKKSLPRKAGAPATRRLSPKLSMAGAKKA